MYGMHFCSGINLLIKRSLWSRFTHHQMDNHLKQSEPVKQDSEAVESHSGLHQNTSWVIVEIPPEKILFKQIV